MTKRNKIIAIAVAVGLTLSGVSLYYFNTGEYATIAKVGTASIKQKDLTKELDVARNYIKQQNSKITDEEVETQIKSYEATVKEKIINDKIFETMAKKLNVLPAEDELVKQTDSQISTMKSSIGGDDAYKKYLADNKITETYIKGEIRKQLISDAVYNYMFKDIKVTDAETKKYYDEHKSEFVKGAGAEFYHVAASSLADGNKIKKEIDAGLSFENAAKKYNKDGTETASGYIGFIEFKNNQYFSEDVMNQLRALKDGQSSAPVKVNDTYHLFMLKNATNTDKQLSYDEAKANAQSSIEGSKKSEIYNKTLENWKKELGIK